MPDLNTVVITGNLTRDPELRQAGSTNVCRLRVAVNERVRDSATGEWGDRPNYFDVTVWGAQGENCERHLSKGRGVAVDGRLRWREFETDGQKRQAVEIVAATVKFLGGGNGASTPPAERQRSGRRARFRPVGRVRRRHPVLTRHTTTPKADAADRTSAALA